MPIRFRCAYCNQLLGIARRKAGQVVRCPTCAGQVIVPQEDDLPPEQPQSQPSPPPAAEAPLFEREDFGIDFDNPISMPPPHSGGAPAAAPPAPAPAWGTAPVPSFDVERYSPDVVAGEVGGAGGIVLSPAKATLLTVLAILGMAVAFGVGLIVGRFAL